MRSIAIPLYIKQIIDTSSFTNEERINVIKKNYASLSNGIPEVSVVIPAYNEEDGILLTLQSLSANSTNRVVEIIVVNNNSKDNTEALVLAM